MYCYNVPQYEHEKRSENGLLLLNMRLLLIRVFEEVGFRPLQSEEIEA